MMRLTRHLLLFFAILALTIGCTKPNRSEEVKGLIYELQGMLFENPEKALARVDSAEQVCLISTDAANFLRSTLYAQMGKSRLAIFYGEQFKDHPELASEGFSYYSQVLWLCKELKRHGEWGKALQIADEVNEYLGKGDVEEQTTLGVKSRLLIFKGDCEKDMGHMEKAERYYLEGINLLIDSITSPKDYWVIDGLAIAVIETTEFYLEWGKIKKTLPLIAKGDTAIARMKRCPDMPEYVYNVRSKNNIITQALNYAANGLYDKADSLYQEHRQASDLSTYDLVAEARYLTMIGRYDEAIRMFRKTDSLYLAKGSDINSNYINNFMMSHYRALEKAGRKDEAIAYGDYIRHLTDSIHLQEKKIDVEQQEEIHQKETEITSRRQSLIIHRIILVGVFLICLLIAYFLWRSHQYNKELLEKNRRLLVEIEQREREEQLAIEQLQAEPEETLTAGQQLYRRICTLMKEQQPYTEENLNRDTLAQLLGTNAKYVAQAIHECSNGETVTDFITRYRLEHVVRLLKTTNDPIAIIGEMSGIPSRATLARLFRNAYGMTCSEFREVAKEKQS